MAVDFEESMPGFWKKVGDKMFGISGTITLALFINLHADLNGLRSQITDLYRYSKQLVPQDERQRGDQQLEVKRQGIQQLIEKNLKEWQDSSRRLEQGTEQLTEERERSLQSVAKSIGDLRVRLAALESLPEAALGPDTSRPPTGTSTKEQLARDRRQASASIEQ
jgi:hypothetical protein